MALQQHNGVESSELLGGLFVILVLLPPSSEAVNVLFLCCEWLYPGFTLLTFTPTEKPCAFGIFGVLSEENTSISFCPLLVLVFFTLLVLSTFCLSPVWGSVSGEVFILHFSSTPSGVCSSFAFLSPPPRIPLLPASVLYQPLCFAFCFLLSCLLQLFLLLFTVFPAASSPPCGLFPLFDVCLSLSPSLFLCMLPMQSAHRALLITTPPLCPLCLVSFLIYLLSPSPTLSLTGVSAY